MNKKNVIYLILGIVVFLSIGFSIYHFNNFLNDDNYLDTLNQDEDNLYDSNESYDNDEGNTTSGEDDDLESNNNNDNIINSNNQDNNENYLNEDNTDNDIDNGSIDNDKNYFIELSVNDFVNLIDNKSDFILVISQTLCGHCTSYKPKVEEIANNYKVIVYYIEYNMLSENDKNIFNGYVEFLGTPTTVFFKDGVEIIDARIDGDTTNKKIESAFRDNGYIK